MELRNEDDLHEPLAKSDLTARLPYFSFPKSWNQLSPECKSSRNCTIFINKLKLSLLNTYSNVLYAPGFFARRALPLINI
jgi:hypothetical protein